ncbi:BPSS1780 family membrane protein [Paraburkholderia sp. D15]|uniref:BPSS1780 family membrane protein n=1 Tax=Paraburkholderia sp. D15 TaxID=2880218 RepID=UPI002479B9B5|nr:BPSS1780 family membrane protein [Paraburkholderia sp. D15]WGS52691.1 BPSS1780 family membrane protein [Paraburkholderia sp. D15]
MKMHYSSDPVVADGARIEREWRLPGARLVDVSSVVNWFAEGLQIASAKPLLWLAVILIRADVATLLAYARSLSLLAVLVTPFAMAVALLMQERASRGGRWSVRDVIGAVHAQRNALLTIGLCCVAVTYVGHVISLAAFHVSMTTYVAPNGVHALTFAYATHADANNPLEPLVDLLLRVLPVSLMWFAPALVVLNKASAFDAMTASVRAVARNWQVACLYVVVVVSVMLLASFTPLIVRALVLTPLASALIVMSLYGSYRDVFGGR